MSLNSGIKTKNQIMKKLILLIFVCIPIILFGQDDKNEYKTLFDGKSLGGYGAVSGGYAPINNENAVVFNARGGIVLGHAVAVGIGGTGFITEYQYNSMLQKKVALSGGYGGGFIELIVLGRLPVHISIPLFGGLGGVAYSTWENEGTSEIEQENSILQTAIFGVLEPGVELEFNIAPFCRMAVYATYRFTTNVDLKEIIDGQSVQLVDQDALTGYSAGLIFKFGKF